MKAVDVVIMAAGKGTRMHSSMPKVLQHLGDKALVQHVIDTAKALQARTTVVITGHGAELVEAALAGQPGLQFVRQMPQLGTGHALKQAAPVLPDDGVTVVLSGDVPLTQADTLQALMDATQGERLALHTLEMADPTGYGRIVRQADGSVQAIVEHKDASDEQRRIREIYSGIMAVPTRLLLPWLKRLRNDNAQQEYYRTDVVKLAVADGQSVVAQVLTDPVQVAGVNTPVQLAELERAYQQRRAHALMLQGVRLRDPARFDVRGELTCERDVEIDVNCLFQGRVHLGEGVRIGAHCVLSNVTIAAGAVLQPFTCIEGGTEGVTVEPSTLADGAKANHLAYLGDATVGERVNYGAGSITANYDGAHKHRTVIEADVHVGSNCVLVAPVTLGAGGTIAGGSTITKSTEPGALSVARGKQVSIPNWKRPTKPKP